MEAEVKNDPELEAGVNGANCPRLSDLQYSGRIEYNSTIGSVCISRIDDPAAAEKNLPQLDRLEAEEKNLPQLDRSGEEEQNLLQLDGFNFNQKSEEICIEPFFDSELEDDDRRDIMEPNDSDIPGKGRPKRKRKRPSYLSEDNIYKRRPTTPDLQSDRLVSNSLVDCCTSRCVLCGRMASHDTILKHISSTHKTSQKDNYVMMTRSYYKCRICDSEMVFFLGRIKEHLKRRHKTTLGAYKARFQELTEKVTYARQEKPQQDFSQCNLCGEIFLHLETLAHLQNVHEAPTEDNFNYVTKHEIKLKATERKIENEQEEVQEIIEAWKHTLIPGVEFFTDNLKDKCLRQCDICQKLFTDDSLRNHLRLYHTNDEERKTSREHRVVKLTYHRCRLCNKTLRFTFNVVSKHLKKRHFLKFNEYKEKCGVFHDQGEYKSGYVPSSLAYSADQPPCDVNESLCDVKESLADVT